MELIDLLGESSGGRGSVQALWSIGEQREGVPIVDSIVLRIARHETDKNIARSRIASSRTIPSRPSLGCRKPFRHYASKITHAIPIATSQRAGIITPRISTNGAAHWFHVPLRPL
jgi:hypothetical protein